MESEVLSHEHSKESTSRRSSECVRYCNPRLVEYGRACGGVYIVEETRMHRNRSISDLFLSSSVLEPMFCVDPTPFSQMTY